MSKAHKLQGIIANKRTGRARLQIIDSAYAQSFGEAHLGIIALFAMPQVYA